MSDPDEPPVRRLPGRVFTMLCAATVAFETAILEPFQGLVNFGRLDLAEVCCTRVSKLTAMVNASGGKAERFSMWNGFDLSTTGGTNRLIAELKRRRPRYLWFAPGCDPWSSINNLNAGDPDREARLRIKRAKSKRIFRNCERAMPEYLAQGPDSEIVGEQPRRAQS